MKASQLRDLSRKYASGGISREDYLQERRRLIDAITRGEVELEYHELDPNGVNAQKADTSRRPGRTLLAAAGLLLVLVVAFTTHFLSGNGNAESRDADEAMAAGEVPAQSVNPAIETLRSFSTADDWSEASLSALENDWANYSAAQREEAQESIAYRRLAREVQARIREHEALVAAGGDPDALMRAARLRMFAERIGFST